MYAGYMLAHLGYLLVAPSWWNLSIYLAVWTLLIMRIFAEERILNLDPGYETFKAGVRYRIVPGIF
jgi:protein-S-isoprenylcysteine O-methyltransferase Ste14